MLRIPRHQKGNRIKKEASGIRHLVYTALNPQLKVSKMRWLDIALRSIRLLFEALSRFIFGIIYYGEPHKPLPPINNLILLESATSLATKIRTKKLTSVEVVKSFIGRIKEINPILNCVVDDRFDDAVKDAKAVDDLIRSGTVDEQTLSKNKPFLGVPFTTKDCMAVKGLRQTAGLYSRRNFIAEEDADVVHLMREAGAIPLCVTNVSELCMWWESSNTIYGRTNNPYRSCRIVGGSSGGEGCVQSACGSPFGIGSDIGGSIRMPSFFNGIFGHKPTYGIVSNIGQEPVATGEAMEFLVTGPMCRYVQDLTPMMKVLGANNSHMLTLDQKVDISKLRYFYVEDDGGSPLVTPVHPELRAAQKKVIIHLEKAYGVKAKKITLKKLKAALPMYFAKLASVEEAHTFCEELALKKGCINVWTELLKWMFRLSHHTLPGLLLGVLEKLNSQSKRSEDYPKLLTMCTDLKQEIKELLGDDGVLLFPSHPTPAPYHGQPLFRAFNFVYTAIINVLLFPSTQCPLGLGSEGLPLGIQVVGNHYKDHLTLAVAGELEKAFGGWVCPSEVR
ncbi:fatty-acid amide hydrolase 2-A isoform X2 [Penaeus vannamei]|uniref:fatty-acid amide hydrolase 2-A isoform X2 n=1 Tax=Penaeus vannamei TaxID=6689 RepID=UPI000F691634|nr:fatty-acid amide hydrolase 2-A-like isoform X2 [Penaeus vannamei]